MATSKTTEARSRSNATDMTMSSFWRNCNGQIRKSLENELRHGKLNSPQYCRVIATEALDPVDVKRVGRIEPLSATRDHQTLNNHSSIDRSPEVTNICINELFTEPNPERSRNPDILKSKMYTGQNSSGPMAVTGPDNSKCKYVHESNMFVRNVDDGSYSKIVPPNSSLQTGKSGLKTSNSSLQTSNLSSQSGKTTSKTSFSRLHTGKSSLQASSSTLHHHGGSNGPCKHVFASNKKPSSDDGFCCRICHSVADIETLVSPCLCTGSMKYVHESCLLNWLKSSVRTKCELCLHEVPVKKLIKPLREWRFLDEKPVPIIWLISFLILFTLNILSVIKDASRGCKTTTCIVFYVLGSTGAILGVIFFWFWAKKCAVYFKKLLVLNQVWLLDGNNCKTHKKPTSLASNCNV